MKNMKKLIALLLAMTMVLSMGISAMAMGEGEGDGESGEPAVGPVGALTPDTEMIISGLDNGDVVKFYKLIKWVPGEGWAWETGVEAAATSAGVTLPDLEIITGKYDKDADPKYTPGVISAANGGILAQVAQKLSAAYTGTAADGKVTYTNPTPADEVPFLGLYVALVTPATADYVYNPVFVAADYNPDSTNTNNFAVEEGTLSYSDKAMAKKQKVELHKTSGTTADVQYDVAIGDTIPFTITSIIPEFSTSYQEPMYEITDKMSTGLELLDTPAIKVEVKDTTATAWTTLTEGTEYTVTKNGTAGFTVKMKTDYLKGNTAAKDIRVTYSGKVTQIPDENVVFKENTATVKFSNDPGDKNSYSLLEDKTNHYTFSLDANMLGESGWENSELVKIGLDPQGNEITQKTLSNGHSAGVLEGAEFGLYTDEECTTLYTNNNVTPAVTGKFTSDSMGKLNISGLDTGIYFLKEISAPAGYIKSTDTWQIDITAKYETEPEGSYTKDGILVKYDAYDYLVSYDVKVKNLKTGEVVDNNYTIVNEGTYEKTPTKIKEPDKETKLANTQGTELPSTGGIGTTLFYIVGSVLVLGAAVLLISKRRMSAR